MLFILVGVFDKLLTEIKLQNFEKERVSINERTGQSYKKRRW